MVGRNLADELREEFTVNLVENGEIGRDLRQRIDLHFRARYYISTQGKLPQLAYFIQRFNRDEKGYFFRYALVERFQGLDVGGEETNQTPEYEYKFYRDSFSGLVEAGPEELDFLKNRSSIQSKTLCEINNH